MHWSGILVGTLIFWIFENFSGFTDFPWLSQSLGRIFPICLILYQDRLCSISFDLLRYFEVPWEIGLGSLSGKHSDFFFSSNVVGRKPGRLFGMGGSMRVYKIEEQFLKGCTCIGVRQGGFKRFHIGFKHVTNPENHKNKDFLIFGK